MNPSERWDFRAGLKWVAAAAAVVAGGLLGATPGAGAAESPRFTDAAQAFFGATLTNLHTVHLRLTADQWDAMDAKRLPNAGGGPFGGPGGGPGGPGGPPAGGPPGGPGGPARSAPGGPPNGQGPGPGGPGGPGGGFNAAFERGEAARPGLAAAMGLDFPFVKADVEIDGERVGSVGLRYKGNGTYMFSQNADKRPMKLDFGRYQKGQTFRGLKALNLHNNVMDPTAMREALGYAVSREFGVPGPRTAYARVLITIEGRQEKFPLGLYTLTEQPNGEFLQAWFGSKKGLLMKPGAWESLNFRGDDWKAYARVLNVQEDGTAAEHTRMIGFLKLLQEGTAEEFSRRVGEFVDVENTARFLALNVALANLDSILTLGQNYYVFLEPKASRLHWWLWDLDQSWGAFGMMGSTETRLNLSIQTPWQGENRLIERLLGADAIKPRYRAALASLIQGPMEPAKLKQQIQELAGFLRPLIGEEGAARQTAFDEAVGLPAAAAGPSAAPATNAPRPGPGGPGGPGGFGMPPLPLLAFVEGRAKSIADQLAGKSAGERLEMGGPGGPPPEEGRGDRPGNRLVGVGPGPGPGPGGPPRGGMRLGGPGGPFNPGRMLSTPFLRDGDRDGNGELSTAEMTALGKDWFARWDTNHTGTVTRERLIDGLSATLMGPGGGGPPMGPPGMGAATPQRLRTNAPAGGGMMFRGPGMFLAPAFLTAGDTNHDDQLSAAEAASMFAGWATNWDQDHNGSLTSEELGEGFQAIMPFPGPGGPGGPGRPGGPGPRAEGPRPGAPAGPGNPPPPQ